MRMRVRKYMRTSNWQTHFDTSVCGALRTECRNETQTLYVELWMDLRRKN